jgi:hypothetical protein
MARTASSNNRRLVVHLLCVLTVCSFGATEVFPQAPAARRPFDTITIAVQVVGSTALGSFDDNWDPGAGGRVELSTPFYTGLAQAGLHVFGHDAIASTASEFGSAYLYLGWMYEWKLPRRLAWAAGARMGVVYMMFDDVSTPSSRLTETELGFAVASEWAYTFTSHWSFVLDAEYRKVLTRQPIEYLFAGVGVGRTFSTPRWLREFLE